MILGHAITIGELADAIYGAEGYAGFANLLRTAVKDAEADDLLPYLQQVVCDLFAEEPDHEHVWVTYPDQPEMVWCRDCGKHKCEVGLPKVVVEVRGGVAEVSECPDGVEVEIRDHDNGD